MKKSYLFLAVSAIALSACTSEDVIDVSTQKKQNNVIGFENVINKLSRQGDVEDLTNGFKKFQVFGYYTKPENPKNCVEVFHDVTVSRDDNGEWSYPGELRYWVPNAHYYFYAYSCGDITKLDDQYGSFTLNMDDEYNPIDRVLKINNYICDATHQHDLIFASNTGATEANEFFGIVGQTKGNELVSLQFKHLLSKVQASFTSKFPSEYDVKISNVSLENIRNIGNYNPNAGTDPNTGRSVGAWQNVERKNNVGGSVLLLDTSDTKVSPLELNIKDTDAKTTNSAYVLPYSYNGQDKTETTPSTYVYLKFTLTLYHNGERVLNKVMTGKFNPSWTPGYTYTYNVVVDGSAANLEVIAFEVTKDDKGNEVSNWATDGQTLSINMDK